jgi:hypothetical protein
MKTGLNNVLLPTLFIAVNNIEQYCYTRFRLNNIVQYCWQVWTTWAAKHCSVLLSNGLGVFCRVLGSWVQLYKTLNYFLTHYFVVDFDKATGYLFIPVVTGGSFREFAPILVPRALLTRGATRGSGQIHIRTGIWLDSSNTGYLFSYHVFMVSGYGFGQSPSRVWQCRLHEKTPTRRPHAREDPLSPRCANRAWSQV